MRIYCDTLGRIDLQDPRQQVFSLGDDPIWNMESPVSDLLQDIVDIRVIEGQAAREQCVENHTAAPNVRRGARIFMTLDNLWRRVVRRTAASAKEAVERVECGHAKVGNLNPLNLHRLRRSLNLNRVVD